MRGQSNANLALWHDYPWLTGLVLAPLLFGSVNPEGQAAVGGLFAISLFLLAPHLGRSQYPLAPRVIVGLAVVLFLLPLVPLPFGLVEVISPWRARLAKNFPLEPGATTLWLPLTASVANTLQRYWELTLVLTCFSLARHATVKPAFVRQMARFIAVAVAALVASDIWYRLSGRQTILGLWKVSWGYGAGTFANPNHFANWVFVAVLFLLGGLLRALSPLHSARTEDREVLPRRGVPIGWVILLSAGAILAVLTGSRGAFLGFALGGVTWLGLLARRSHNQGRWAWVAFGGLALIMVLVVASDLLLRKLALIDAHYLTRYAKLHIWHQAWLLALKFPWLGSGWGSFVTLFNHFKDTWGDGTALHAENDYLQLLVETGVAGTLVYGAVLCFAARAALTVSLRTRTPEPEYLFGAVAGLSCFALNAVFEFVCQVPANALLAAALLGFVVGCLDQARAPVVPALPTRGRIVLNFIWALALGATAVCQGLAWWHWHKAGQNRATAAGTQIEQSLAYWPWASNRRIGLARAETSLSAGEPREAQREHGSRIRARLNEGLFWDPYHWELRLERAWLDLAFSTNQSTALAEAREVVALNPRQPQVGLRFARYYASRQPAVALEFLRTMDRSSPRALRQALELAWQLQRDTGTLWALTPVAPPSLSTLGEFALERKLHPLAAQAYLRLTNSLPPPQLAEKLLAAQRPDLVLKHLAPSLAPLPARHWLCRAHFELGQFAEVNRLTQTMIRESRLRYELESVPPSTQELSVLRLEWANRTNDVSRARRLADRLFQSPPTGRDLRLLRQLASQFPQELHFAWLVFQTQHELGQEREAAETALGLAARLAALP